MDWITAFGLVIAAGGTLFGFLQWRNSSKRNQPAADSSKPDAKELLHRLTDFIWRYPETGENQTSWAVKESLVLAGNLEAASEGPGIGAAIITTEWAAEIFGPVSLRKTDACIAWAMARRGSAPPHLLEGEIRDSRTSRVIRAPDFRHTLAFGIILARSGRLPETLSKYLEYALDHQSADGGWPPGEGVTVSETFTVCYAAELLELCCANKQLAGETRDQCLHSGRRAVEWLIRNRDETGLWRSEIVDAAWDELWATAWIVMRLAGIRAIGVPGWGECIAKATVQAIERASAANTWSGADILQRFRVEARVGAAISAAMKSDCLGRGAHERAEIYQAAWRARSMRVGLQMAPEEWDLATALFFLLGYLTPGEMRTIANRVLEASPAH